MSAPEESLAAKVYTGIRDVVVYVGEMAPGRRWWLGPWRPIEWVVGLLILGPTLWYVDDHPLGTTTPQLFGGVGLFAAAVFAMRLFLPKTRPSLWARFEFARNLARPPREAFERPRKVVGNIVFTKGGVYAEYLFDGVSTALDSIHSHLGAAQLTRNFGRYLPSGSMPRGLLVAEDTRATMRAMTGGYDADSPWITQCRHWEPILANPTRLPDASRRPPARQRYWLTIPVDGGITGRTRIGTGKRFWDFVVGKDKDSDEAAVDYAEVAATIIAGLPRAFDLRPATPAQIRWYHRHRATLGIIHEPMPSAAVEPATLTEDDFDVIEYDEGDNANNPWWRPSLKPFLRVGESYQTFLVLTHFPAKGIRFPRSSYAHALWTIDLGGAVVEWTQHHIIRTPEEINPKNRRYIARIGDQIIQRGTGADESVTEELYDKLSGTREYIRALDSTPAERELDHAIVVVVGAASPEQLDTAVVSIRHELDAAGIVATRWRGAQAALAKAFFTGSEENAFLDEFRNPTTAHYWSLFLPFITGWVGDTKGSPLAVNQTTAHPVIILDEPEAASRHNLPTTIAVVGEPGAGKSKRVKISASELLCRGGRIVVFEPDLMGEWFKALRPFEYLGVRFIDIMAGQYCFDTLLMADDPAEGTQLSAAHVLPWIGLPANDIETKRYRRLIRPENRDRLGITGHQSLINYLSLQKGADKDPLLARLETAKDDFPAFFNDDLPVYRPDTSAATVYLTGRLKLPDKTQMENKHLFEAMETPERTGIAIYGMLVEVEQTYMFSRGDRFDWMIFEECAEICSYRQGAKLLHMISRKGRRHNTGLVLINQDFRQIQKMNDEFVVEKWISRIRNRDLAYETLRWAGFDVRDKYDHLVTELCENTSPRNEREHDTELAEAGAVDPWREGEGFLVDKGGRRARVQFLWAPTAEQDEATNTSVIGGAGMREYVA